MTIVGSKSHKVRPKPVFVVRAFKVQEMKYITPPISVFYSKKRAKEFVEEITADGTFVARIERTMLNTEEYEEDDEEYTTKKKRAKTEGPHTFSSARVQEITSSGTNTCGAILKIDL